MDGGATASLSANMHKRAERRCLTKCVITVSLAVALLFPAQRTVAADVTTNDFTFIAKFPTTGKAFLDYPGTFRIVSRSDRGKATTAYYCGADAKPGITATTDGVTSESFVAEIHVFCTFRIPNGLIVSPVPIVAFADGAHTFHASYAGQTRDLTIYSIKLDWERVVGFAILDNDIDERETFDVHYDAEEGKLDIDVRILHCGELAIDTGVVSDVGTDLPGSHLLEEHAANDGKRRRYADRR